MRALNRSSGLIPDDRVQNLDAPVVFDEVIPFVTSLLPSLSTDAHIAIIALNDDGAVGALLAFEAAGRLDQVVAVGQGADRLARALLCRPDYPLVGSTMFAPESYGERLLELALRILDGHPVPPAVYSRHVSLPAKTWLSTIPNSQDVLPSIDQVRALVASGGEGAVLRSDGGQHPLISRFSDRRPWALDTPAGQPGYRCRTKQKSMSSNRS